MAISAVLVAEGDGPKSRSEAVERWSLAGGVAEVAKAVGCSRGTMFVRGDQSTAYASRLPSPYLTIYECDGADCAEAILKATAASFDDGSLPLQRRAISFVPVFSLGGPSDLESAAGLLVVLLDNTEPDREVEFTSWYNKVHLSDVVRAGGYRGATRFENASPSSGGPRYLALYEADSDPLEAHQGVLDKVSEMKLWPAVEQFHVADYARLTR